MKGCLFFQLKTVTEAKSIKLYKKLKLNTKEKYLFKNLIPWISYARSRLLFLFKYDSKLDFINFTKPSETIKMLQKSSKRTKSKAKTTDTEKMLFKIFTFIILLFINLIL